MGTAEESIKGDTIRVERNQMESLDGKLEGQEALLMAAIQGMGFGQGLALRPVRDFARNGWPLRGSSGHDWVGRPTVGGWPTTSASGTGIC